MVSGSGSGDLYPAKPGRATRHPPSAMGDAIGLNHPELARGKKIARGGIKNAIISIAGFQCLIGAVITDWRLSPKDRAAEKHGAELASSPGPGTFSSHLDLLWKSAASPTHIAPALGYCRRPSRPHKSSQLLLAVLSCAGCVKPGEMGEEETTA